MNEKIFALILVVLAVLSVVLLPGAPIAALEIMTLKLLYVAFLLAVAYALLHFLRGTKYDVHAEIFDQSNLAASLFVASLIISLALVIGK
jgi:hypothetical protein